MPSFPRVSSKLSVNRPARFRTSISHHDNVVGVNDSVILAVRGIVYTVVETLEFWDDGSRVSTLFRAACGAHAPNGHDPSKDSPPWRTRV